MFMINEANKPEVKQTIVVYAGRFQPFHPGHYAVYKHLVDKFGKNNVYIGSSDDTSGPKSPLQFKEKKLIAVDIFGVPNNRFVKVKNPYRPVEILSKYDGKTTQYVAALGEKDSERLSGKYFRPYKGKAGYGYDEIGYTYNVPMQAGGISATEIRKGISNKDKNKAKEFFKKVYPKYDADIFLMIRNALLGLNEDGFPGGVFTGLTSPQGYINGAPKPKDVKKMRKKLDSEKVDELYDPINNVINNKIAEEMFTEFIKNYLGEADEKDAEKEKYTHIGYGLYKLKGQEDKKDSPTFKRDDAGKFQQVGKDEFEKAKKVSADRGKEQEEKPKQEPSAQSSAETPDTQKLDATDFRTDAEKSDQEKSHTESDSRFDDMMKGVSVSDRLKVGLKELWKDFNTEEQHDAHEVMNPESKTKKSWKQRTKNFFKEFPSNVAKASYGIAKAKYHQIKNTGKAIQSLVVSTMNGGKPQFGWHKNEKGEWQHNEHEAKKQKKACLKTAVDVAVVAASVVTGGAISGAVHHVASQGAAGVGTAAIHGATGVFHHGVGGFAAHAAFDFGRHCALESLHLAHGASHGSAYGQAAVHGLAQVGGGELVKHLVGLTETRIRLTEAADGSKKLKSNANLFANLVADIVKKLSDFQPTSEQLYDAMVSYKKTKSTTGLVNLMKPAEKNGLNESIAKENSINNFVEWASGRLKLSEVPKVELIGGTEISETQTSLGGYNPDTKTIFVQTEKRLSADIIRTIAHEMVHRKQDELGLIKDPIKDGATGSPIENQANAVAGILLRDYGKLNKKIYTESKKFVEEAIIDDTMDSAFASMKDKIKKKYSSIQSIKYDTEYKTYTFVFGDKKDADDFRIKFHGTNSQLAQFDKIDYSPKDNPTTFFVKFKTKMRDEHYVSGTGMFNRKLSPQQKIDKLNPARAMQKAKIWHKTFSHHDPDTGEIETEDINLPVNKGDEILVGKFKNKRIIVKDIGEDEHGMPTINGRSVVNFRRSKKKELNEVSNVTRQGVDSQQDGAFLPAGKTRIMGKSDGVNKKDKWYHNGGYTQVDFPTADPIYGDDDENIVSIQYVNQNLPRTEKKFQTDFETYDGPLLERLLTEGGAAGHMSHPFDDMNLTFGDLKTIITGALNGELGVVKEKLDGQALAISWKKGRLIAARNKSHIKNAGADAMGIEDVANKFAGRGGLTDAYNFAMKDLNAAISGLSNKQKEKIFNEGKCFMNIEVIWPESVNVIPYGQAMLVFHNTTCYDDDGNAVGADASAARVLAGMIKQINANVQSRYTISGPAITEIPKNKKLSSMQSTYLSKLNKLQKEFGSKDDDTMGRYHEMWWENFIDENAPTNVDKLTKAALVRRWAFGDKSFRLNTISNEQLRDWAMKTDKVNVEKQQRENMKKFEEIFLGVGSEVLQFVSSAVTVNPDLAVRAMKDELAATADEISKTSDAKKIEKFKNELKRLKGLGGIDKIVPIEGIVFNYNGKIYKLTGTFAPLNQLLGIFYS